MKTMSLKNVLVVFFIVIFSPLTLADKVVGMYEADFPAKMSLDIETHIDLKYSMDLAGHNLINMLNPKYNYLPYFLVSVDESYKAEVHFFHPDHNMGRWWDAMLRLEDATGFVIPAHIEGAMLENQYRFHDNPDNLCLLPLDLPHTNGALFCFHSFREQLSALDVLVRYRNNRWAVEAGHKMLQTLKSILLPEDQWRPRGTVWDVTKTQRYQQQKLSQTESGWSLNLQGSEGRLIEPLIYYYQATKDPLALELAERFAKFHLSLSVRPDGKFYATPVVAGHNHSYQGTLKGLLLYGIFTGQREYIDKVEKTYDVAIPEIVKHSGYTCHNLGQETGGEVSSVADAMILALWLGVRGGYPQRLDDAARLLRCRMVPSQILESPPLTAKIQDGSAHTSTAPDGRVIVASCPDNMQQMIIGALGGVHGRPHAGKWSVTDVTAAALTGMIEIYNHITVCSDEWITIYFHLDYEDDTVRIKSLRTQQATVTMDFKRKENVKIRIPGWVPRESVEIRIAGQKKLCRMDDYFLYIPAEELKGQVVLTYDLPVHKETETTAGTAYELTWRGDEIIGICPNSSFYPFYPTAADCK